MLNCMSRIISHMLYDKPRTDGAVARTHHFCTKAWLGAAQVGLADGWDANLRLEGQQVGGVNGSSPGQRGV